MSRGAFSSWERLDDSIALRWPRTATKALKRMNVLISMKEKKYARAMIVDMGCP
jgi:hypothetical protein